MTMARKSYTVIISRYFRKEGLKLNRGRLYSARDDEFIVEVNYKFHDKSEASWWGELVPEEYKQISDGDGYTIELQDGRKGRCSLKKRVNKAVMGIPPLYYYYFRVHGPLE